jgi:hypothetical protein
MISMRTRGINFGDLNVIMGFRHTGKGRTTPLDNWQQRPGCAQANSGGSSP